MKRIAKVVGIFFLKFQSVLQRLIYDVDVLLESFSLYLKEIFFYQQFHGKSIAIAGTNHASIQKINLYLTRCFAFRMIKVSDNQIKCNINIW